jgi:DNA processing protein
MSEEPADVLAAAAYLSRVAEPASVPLYLLVSELGYVAAAEAVLAGEVSSELREATEARRLSVEAEADLEAADRNDIRLITPASGEWPHFALAPLYVSAARRCAEWTRGNRARPNSGELIPPLALWLRGAGNLRDVGLTSLAIVGSRAATSYGQQVAAELAHGLAARDVVVVSGGAYGIDAAAHRGALSADGATVLVSAGGLDRPYPAGHDLLYARTAEVGVLVSERPPGSAPHRQRFLSRNRLIAAFGSATLVVEAARRSGALNSARYARDLGRPVLAVPGPITSAMSGGCHALIQREEAPAFLVTGLQDVLPFCTPLGSAGDSGGQEPCPAQPAGTTGAAARDGLDDSAKAVLDGFPARGFVTEADLARLSGRPIQQVLAALPSLTQLGLIRSGPRGHQRVQGVAS